MRPLLQFAGFCFIVFFIVGELQGWYVGMPPSSPMYLYKMDKTVNVVRDVKYVDELEFGMHGKASRGTVIVEVFFEIPPSFQSGTTGTTPKRIFSQEFFAGERIDISEFLKKGKGRYTVRLTYTDVTGTFRMELPKERDL
ncbi:MAG: hypothetical protein KC422_21670 [Trueperaceae bacterium]|nr:hypothetical protein [Trueperaceae bacterium]